MSVEKKQLNREVLSKPGGATADPDQPWTAVTPRDAVDRMDALLEYVEQCGGNPLNYRSDLSEHAAFKPFSLSERIAQNAFYVLCREHIAPAWFDGHTRIASNNLSRFYDAVLGSGHHLPYVETPEGQTSPVSWFRSTGHGLWISTRPSTGIIPLLTQDAATASALYGRPRLPLPYAYRTRRAPLDSWTAPRRAHAGRGDLSELLLLVRQMNGETGDGLLSEAIRAHVKRVADRHRPDARGRPAADTGGIPVSLYRDD